MAFSTGTSYALEITVSLLSSYEAEYGSTSTSRLHGYFPPQTLGMNRASFQYIIGVFGFDYLALFLLAPYRLSSHDCFCRDLGVDMVICRNW